MYLGPNKISKETKLDSDYIEVEFDGDAQSETYNSELLEKVKTKKETDLTTLRNARCDFFLEKILEILLACNVKTAEIPHLIQSLGNVAHNTEKDLFEKLVGASLQDITFLRADEILKS